MNEKEEFSLVCLKCENFIVGHSYLEGEDGKIRFEHTLECGAGFSESEQLERIRKKDCEKIKIPKWYRSPPLG